MKIVTLISWILLFDGHAIPILGLSPSDLKDGKKKIIKRDGVSIKHTTGLNALVSCLGFDGGFAGYKKEGWPKLQRLMKENGLFHYKNLLDIPRYSLGFDGMGRRRRDLADRLFLDERPLPGRVFTGYGHDWETWDPYDEYMISPEWTEDDNSFHPKNHEEARLWLFGKRLLIFWSFNFLSDHFFDVEQPEITPSIYFPNTMSKEMIKGELFKARKVAKTLNLVMKDEDKGWLDIIPVTKSLILLGGPNNTYDILWRNLRQSSPNKGMFDLSPIDTPKQDFKTWNYFRLNNWLEKERHEAENYYYFKGGISQDYPGNDVILEDYLSDKGIGPKKLIEGAPDEFTLVNLPSGTRLFVSQMVTVKEFLRFLEETNYAERREGESWGAANNHNLKSSPVGVTIRDAVAFCAWKERELGVSVRLLELNEHRLIRPFASEHYKVLSSGYDFFWDQYPPKGGLKASVEWSISRFIEPGPDVPEFPPANGVMTTRYENGMRVSGISSRRRWISPSDFPPEAVWSQNLPWGKYLGLDFIDAWDAYEWCWDGRVSGRYWEGSLVNSGSWGASKNSKIGFRLVIEASEEK